MRAFGLLFAWALGSTALANKPLATYKAEAENSVQDVANHHRYYVDIKLVTKEIEQVFVNKGSKSYFMKRYEPVISGHREMVAEIENFYELNSTIEKGGFSDLSQKVALIESYGADLIGKYRDYYAACNAYQQYLKALRNDLDVFRTQISDHFTLISNQKLRSFGERVIEDIDSWKTFTIGLESNTRNRINRIGAIVPKMQAKAKERLIASYNSWATKKLAKIDATISRAFKVDRIMGRAVAINNNFTIDPVLDNALFFYYDYDTSVRLLSYHKAIAEELHREFNSILGLTDTQKGLVGMAINPVIATAKGELARLKASGWQGMYQQQKDMFAYSIEYPDFFTKTCLDLFRRFLAAKIETHEDYIDWLPTYTRTYQLCFEEEQE